MGALLAAVTLVCGALILTTGDFPATVGDVLQVLTGDGPRGLEIVVTRFRLPRLLVGIGVGAALGAAGSIFQSISRNPLGSPDVIGFTTGSATGALVVLVVAQDSPVGVPVGAILGGVGSALLVYLLAYRRGVQGFRLILVGIGVSSVLAAVNAFLLSRASLADAQGAQMWLVGSLSGRSWDHVVPVWIALVALLPAVALLGKRMSMLEMGDETATARGVPVERTRLTLVVVGVALTAVATAAAGPIAFVALAAPQVAHRLVRVGGAGPMISALTGAALLVGADLAGQRLLLPLQLPVGLSTGAVGGLYLVWLLGREWRRQW
ncbi:ABC-type Fe3+-siderophore transport system, permease 2 component [Alloactinosynnema sp. L-07]|uniref:FecCD family ABC transporter permease n=1 Tax=Alloactinosynnema sp. L-07 TaxID=1653480 RepID=UPI00065F0A6E|nr:ABC-type Fe3+-siderophore transport system, permease 2 component [Alloactinosynnema sp. L-07]